MNCPDVRPWLRFDTTADRGGASAWIKDFVSVERAAHASPYVRYNTGSDGPPRVDVTASEPALHPASSPYGAHPPVVVFLEDGPRSSECMTIPSFIAGWLLLCARQPHYLTVAIVFTAPASLGVLSSGCPAALA